MKKLSRFLSLLLLDYLVRFWWDVSALCQPKHGLSKKVGSSCSEPLTFIIRDVTISTECDGLPSSAGIEFGVVVFFALYAAFNQIKRRIDGRWMSVLRKVQAVSLCGTLQGFSVPIQEIQSTEFAL